MRTDQGTQIRYIMTVTGGLGQDIRTDHGKPRLGYVDRSQAQGIEHKDRSPVDSRQVTEMITDDRWTAT
jgi:hypothetical protein